MGHPDIAALTGLDLFEGADADDVAAITSMLSAVYLTSGATLLRQGDAGSTFFILAGGRAVVRRQGPGDERDVAVVGPGAIVGELAAIRGAPRGASVVAIEPLLAYEGDQSALLALVAAPVVGDRIARRAGERLAANARPIDVRLRDGATVRVRPILPDDRKAAERAALRFSDRARYQRFFSLGPMTASVLDHLFDIDYIDRFSWVVLAGDEPIADGRYGRVRDDVRTAEVAFVVADAHQGRGIGTLMLGAVAVAAGVNGFTRLTADVLADNAAMRRVLDRAGAKWVSVGGSVVQTTIDMVAARSLLAADVSTAMADAVQEISTASLMLGA